MTLKIKFSLPCFLMSQFAFSISTTDMSSLFEKYEYTGLGGFMDENGQ